MYRSPRMSHRPILLTLALVAATLLIVSCKPQPPQPTPAPVSETSTPQPIATGVPLDASPLPVSPTIAPPTQTPQPTATPTSSIPTATPSGPLPTAVLEPVLISQHPSPGEELSLTGTVALTFNQPMDQASVEQALNVEPNIDYSTTWVNANTLQVIPAEGALAQDRELTVVIGEGARSQNGIPIPEAQTIELQTVGSLVVTEAIPGDKADDVSIDALITVMFNRPVVPLVIAEELDTLPQPLIIQPAVSGEGEWLNTSIYIWRPSEPLAGGVTYTVTIDPALRDPLGSSLVEPYSWSFTTSGPEILSVSPENPAASYDDDYLLKLDQQFRVAFNQAMNHETTERAFQLFNVSTETPVAGTFTWEDEDRLLIFQPSSLDIDTKYRIEISTDATNRGGIPLKKPYKDLHHTLPFPAVDGTYPKNNTVMDWWNDSVSLSFNTIMNESSLVAANRITFDPAVEGMEPTVYDYCSEWYSYPGCEVTQLSIEAKLKARTTYTVTLNPGAKDIYGNTITEPYTFTFKTGGLSQRAQINLNEPLGFYDASLPTSVVLTTRNTNKADFKLYNIDLESLVDIQSDYDLLPKADHLLRTWTVEPQAPQDELVSQEIFLAENGGALAPGLYLLTARFPGSSYLFRHIVAVANANLTYKYSFHESLAWLTDLRTGQPIQGAEVKFFNGEALVGSGITDASGVVETATTRALSLYGSGWRGSGTQFAIVNANGIFAIAFDDWNAGITPGSYGLPVGSVEEEIALYLYTDRSIYRPGQEVYFKGILRARDDMVFTLPTTKAAVAVCVEGSSTPMKKMTFDVTAMGTFEGVIELPDGAKLGEYLLVGKSGSAAPKCDDYYYYYGSNQPESRTFRVAEYRKPEFEVLVNAPANAADASNVEANVHSRYFFGGDLPYGEVEWRIYSFPYTFNYTGAGDFNFTDPSGIYEEYYWWYYDYGYNNYYANQGDYVAEGTGTADGEGNLPIQFAADIPETVNGQRYLVQAQVSDAAGNPVIGSTDVIVHNAMYYVGINAGTYVGTVGRSQRVNLIVVDWASNPVASARVQLQFVKREWEREATYADDGAVSYKWVVTETPVGFPINATTNARGEAVATVTPPQGGALKLRATVTDPQGNRSSSSTQLWVSGSRVPYWRTSGNDDHIDLSADKTRYFPGETASILITSPYQGEVKALVTIERGSILSHEVITFSGSSYTYKVPITSQHVPNFYVSVVLIKGADAANPLPSFRMGMTEVKVQHNEQTLNVTLTPNSDVVQPGGQVIYDIRVTDSKGAPVAAELSLALVDRAVLNLAPPNSPPIDTYFYAERDLSVLTAVPLTAYVPRLAVELLPEPEGGRGGGGGGGGPSGPFDQNGVRNEFADTAYWSAFVTTNEQGVAQVIVPLPDNTTSWRLDARAVTADTRVGQSTVDITATLPLLIRPVTPRFFVVQDEVMLSAIVNNNTDQPIEASVMLEAQGLSFQVGVQSVQTVTIPAKGRVDVVWPVIINLDAAWVDLTFHVQGGGFSDAVKPEIGDPDQGYRLPVYRYEVPETVGTAGQIIDGGARMEGIALPSNFDVTQGQVTVQVNPSLAASTLDALDWLEHYEYECAEQLASKVLPNALTIKALRDFNIDDPALEADLEAQINVGVSRLIERQNSDGGWSWWPDYPSNPQVSAYVVHALISARDAGFAVPANKLSKAQSYLSRQIGSPLNSKSEGWKLNRMVYIVYVLSLTESGTADEDVQARIAELYEDRDVLTYYAQALLAQAIWRGNPNDSRIESIKSDLINAAILSATGAHWEENYHDYWNWNTNTRTTAIVLDTFALLWPENDLAPNTTRWLMVAREADHWETTQETTWALIGITDWMRATGELDANYNWSVTLNDAPVGSGQANRDTVTTTSRFTIDVNTLLKEEINRLTFTRDYGAGRLYYTTHLTAYLPVEQISALSRGVTITRRYLDEQGNPVTEAHVGDVLTVQLTIIAPSDLHYVLVEDYYPAGADAVDSNLLTEGSLAEEPQLREEDPFWWGWGWWSFSHIELRDEKAVLSADYLSRGTYLFTYQIRMGVAGEYRVIPAVISEFYFPEVYGRSDGMLFTVIAKEEYAAGVAKRPVGAVLRATLASLLPLLLPVSALLLTITKR